MKTSSFLNSPVRIVALMTYGKGYLTAQQVPFHNLKHVEKNTKQLKLGNEQPLNHLELCQLSHIKNVLQQLSIYFLTASFIGVRMHSLTKPLEISTALETLFYI